MFQQKTIFQCQKVLDFETFGLLERRIFCTDLFALHLNRTIRKRRGQLRYYSFSNNPPIHFSISSLEANKQGFHLRLTREMQAQTGILYFAINAFSRPLQGLPLFAHLPCVNEKLAKIMVLSQCLSVIHQKID